MDELYSQSGHRILRLQNRNICSQFDPIREANLWSEKYAKEIQPGENLIIFGLGAGYHVASLRERFPNCRLAVFEYERRCQSFAESLFPIDLFDLPIFSLEETDLLWKDHRLQKILTGRFRILHHWPSIQICPHWYKKMKSKILGRNLEGINFLFHWTPGFSSMAPFILSDLPVNTNEEGFLSWKIFDHLSDRAFQSIPDQEYYLIRTLRELIT